MLRNRRKPEPKTGQMALGLPGLRVVPPRDKTREIPNYKPPSRKRKGRPFTSWKDVRGRVFVSGEMMPEEKPGTVIRTEWGPGRESYAIVRFDDGSPPCTCDSLRQLRPIPSDEDPARTQVQEREDFNEPPSTAATPS